MAKVCMTQIAVMEQALANLETLWAEWLVEVDDGSWDRKKTEQNIKDFKEVIETMKNADTV